MRLKVFVSIFSMALFFTLSTSAVVNVESCLLCHGSTTSSAPLIEGQNGNYLAKQLFDYKFKNRLNPRMNDLAKDLTDADITYVANYFSQQKWTPLKSTAKELQTLLPGAHLVEQFGCRTCHGESFEGFVKAPRIAGQKSIYIENQLQSFRHQKRSNDFGQMSSLVQFLTDDEINNIAAFLSSY